jgi:DNA-binding NtrC family response regulator
MFSSASASRLKMNDFNRLQKVKTLLVDDDELIRDSLRTVFQNKGLFMRAAESAEEGLAALKEDNFGIIISDLRLPVINGIEFLKLAALTHPQAIKLLITAYRDDRIFSEAVNAGIHEFIEKPFSAKAFIELLAVSLNRRPWVK